MLAGFLGNALILSLGLSIGSFLNVLIERVPKGESILGRSRCPKCRRSLSLLELIPIVSFFLLLGRCWRCRSPISVQYPLVEAASALIYLVVYLAIPFPASLLYYVIFPFLLSLLMIDLKFGVVPTRLIFPAILLSFLLRLAVATAGILLLYLRLNSDKSGFGSYLIKAGYLRSHLYLEFQLLLLTVLGSMMATLIFFLIVKLTKGRGMGEGDIFYALLVGLTAGFPNLIVAFFLAFLLGALVSVTLILLGRKKFGQTVPFGPFLSLGAFIAVFFGEKLIDLYLKLLS